jgi:hypothetical protein
VVSHDSPVTFHNQVVAMYDARSAAGKLLFIVAEFDTLPGSPGGGPSKSSRG